MDHDSVAEHGYASGVEVIGKQVGGLRIRKLQASARSHTEKELEEGMVALHAGPFRTVFPA
jgi:hypothetical protein